VWGSSGRDSISSWAEFVFAAVRVWSCLAAAALLIRASARICVRFSRMYLSALRPDSVLWGGF